MRSIGAVIGADELGGEMSPGPGANEPKYFAIHDFVWAESSSREEAMRSAGVPITSWE
jgi:hypothetical protein